MKKLSLGKTLSVSRIAYGCMSIGGSWDDAPITDVTVTKAVRAVRTALDAGIDFFDHADIYCHGKSETVFARAFSEIKIRREQLFLQSKCGIRFAGSPQATAPHRFDFSYEHIMASTKAILKRLNSDYLDLLLLHRPDALVEPDEVAKAFDELYRAGLVRGFGVSNHNREQIELLRGSLVQPILVNQVEFSLVHTHLLDAGIGTNQNRPSVGADGTLDYCRATNVSIQAWGPLASGRALGGSGDARSVQLANTLTTLATAKNVSKEAIALAWILRHPAGIQPIIGSTDPQRIAAACQADGVHLSREEWYLLYTAGRGEKLP